MGLDDRVRRLSTLNQVPEIARIDNRLLLDNKGKHPLLSKLSKNEKRKLDKFTQILSDKYISIMKKIKSSGAGFHVDQLLRDLAIEYTHRYASSGTNTQPTNFNYFESFCNIRLFSNSVAPYAVPLNEIDHLFTITDYFDFVNSDKSPCFDLSSLINVPENKALHFTTNGDILDFSVLNADGHEFVVSGFSMVRRGNSLHWYLVGGEKLSKEEWEARVNNNEHMNLDDTDPLKRAFLLEAMQENDYKSGSPIELEGTKMAIKTIVAGEIDLLSHKYLARCLMYETENTFEVITDDPEIFDSFDAEKRQSMIDSMIKKVNHASVIWDLVGSMFQLPSYFAYKVKIAKDVVVSAGKQVKPIKSKGGRGTSDKYKIVSTIEIIDSKVPAIQQVIPLHFNTNTDGHWRRLNEGSIGKGPNGNEEIGRTWVNKKSEWRNIDVAENIIYIKSTVKAAEVKIKEYEQAADLCLKSNKHAEESPTSGYGILYILRCTTMQDEVYKVGWTSNSAQTRAEELSSATGVPTSFVVAKYWEHVDAEGLEKNVHAMLEPYRINDRREFFLAPYNTIERIIEAEIKRSLLL